MIDLQLCKEAEDELDDLWNSDESAAATFEALLETLWEDTDLLEYLCVPNLHYTTAPPFEVKRYEEMQRRGYNIFTVKVQTDDGRWPPYRALIGFNAQTSTYYVLAVAHREISYERNDPLFTDVIQRYERAGIPTYR